MSLHIDQTSWDELLWRGYTSSENGTYICEVDPFSMSSFGAWEKMLYKSKGIEFWKYPLPLLEITMFSVSMLWLLFHIFFKKLYIRIPKFTCMMLVGVVLGQVSLLSHDSVVHKIFFPHEEYRQKIHETLGAFGFTLYWFLRGVTMDVTMLKRTGSRAAVIGLATMLIPIISGYIFLFFRWKLGSLTMRIFEYRIITYMESISAFTVISMFLKDQKISHSEFGRIAQSSAMVTDIVAFILAFCAAILWEHRIGLWQTIAAILFFISMIYIVRPSMVWVIKQTPEGRPVKDRFICIILLLAYLSYHYWNYIGLFGPTGPFVLGLAIPDGPPLGSALVQKFESFNLGLIFPLLGSLSIMQVDMQWFFQECRKLKHLEGLVYEAMSYSFFLFTVKLLCSTFSAFSVKMPWRDSALLALVLSNKGVFELSYYMYAVELKAFRPKVFTVVATSLLLNSLIIPIAIDMLNEPSKRFSSYRKRNLLTLKHDSELQALVCIHKPDHIKSIINIIEAFRPSQDSRLSCYVLHLVELIGQATPTFISHQMQRPEPGSMSRSNNVIASFRRFHQKFAESMSVHMFTSVSSAKQIHEDVCWLALDKSLPLILLPFHRTWSLDQSVVVSDDNTVRNLNRNVLKRAPCSVGVLVYRKPIWEPQMTELSCKVCLIFYGGKDDKEALALTNRMRLMNRQISLTIVRLIPVKSPKDRDTNHIVHMLGMEDLMEIIRNNDDLGFGNYNDVKFINITVADGTETNKILRSMAFDYDLFIVGKRSGMDTAITKGLTNWVEFEELGVLGDLLASSDYPSRTSVLVVQQQEYVAHS